MLAAHLFSQNPSSFHPSMHVCKTMQFVFRLPLILSQYFFLPVSFRKIIPRGKLSASSLHCTSKKTTQFVFRPLLVSSQFFFFFFFPAVSLRKIISREKLTESSLLQAKCEKNIRSASPTLQNLLQICATTKPVQKMVNNYGPFCSYYEICSH